MSILEEAEGTGPTWFPDYMELMEIIRGCVPKLHINGHNEFCQFFFSFIYEPYSGMTCGEGIESAWSEQNHAAAFTKEQNPGHRHDMLDDFNGYWNWTKFHQICMFSFVSSFSVSFAHWVFHSRTFVISTEEVVGFVREEELKFSYFLGNNIKRFAPKMEIN